MKQVIVILEGVLTDAVSAFGERTALATARVPHVERLTTRGSQGMALAPGGTVAMPAAHILGHLAGVAPEQAGTLTRAGLEALSLKGTDSPRGKQAWRATLVTESPHQVAELNPPLSLEETVAFGEALTAAGVPGGGHLEPLHSGNFILTLPESDAHPDVGSDPGTCPGWSLGDPLVPRWFGRSKDWFRPFTDWSRGALASHPVNEVRVDLGEDPAHRLWLWGGGQVPDKVESLTAPGLPGKADRMAVFGTCALSRGFARACGAESYPIRHPFDQEGTGPVIRVPDMVEALRLHDLIIVWVSATGPGGQYADPTSTVRALEALDQQLIGPLQDILAAYRPARGTLIAAESHAPGEGIRLSGRMPVLQWGDDLKTDQLGSWNEDTADSGCLGEIPIEALLKVVWG